MTTCCSCCRKRMRMRLFRYWVFLIGCYYFLFHENSLLFEGGSSSSSSSTSSSSFSTLPLLHKLDLRSPWVIVLFSDSRFWDSLLKTARQIRDPLKGNYTGDLALVPLFNMYSGIGGDTQTEQILLPDIEEERLLNTSKELRARIIYPNDLPTIDTSYLYKVTDNFKASTRGLPKSDWLRGNVHDERQWKKRAQYQKLNLFHSFWKTKWQRVFYIDAGTSVFLPLRYAFENVQEEVDSGKMVANYDGGFSIAQQIDPYLSDESKIRLQSLCGGTEIFQRAFQTGMLAFHTDDLIRDDELIHLGTHTSVGSTKYFTQEQQLAFTRNKSFPVIPEPVKVSTLEWLTNMMNEYLVWYTNEQAVMNVAYQCVKGGMWTPHRPCAFNGSTPPCTLLYDPPIVGNHMNCSAAVFIKYKVQYCP